MFHYIYLHRARIRVQELGLLDDESPTSINLGNDEDLSSKGTISYHCGESRVGLTWYQPCPKLSCANRLVNPQMLNK